MYRTLLLFLLSTLVSLAFLQAETPYRIGVILPLSGSNAFGAGMQGGCQMAENDLEQNSKYAPVKLYFEDDQYNPVKTISAFKKLFDHNQIHAVITVSTGPTRAILNQVDKYQIPLLAIATNDGFTAESIYAFSIWLPPEIEAGAMAAEAQRRGYKKLARVTAQNPVFETLNKYFDQQIKNDIELSLDQQFNPNETDFKAILNRIKKIKNLDGIVVNLLPAGAGNFARQARELGITQDLFAAEIYESPEAIKLAKGALENQWYATYANPSSEFEQRFSKKYPNTIKIGAANCYDAVKLLAKSLDLGKTKVVEQLSKIKNYQGAMGTLTVRPDRTFAMPAAIRIVQGSTYKQTSIFHPGAPLQKHN